MMIKIQKYTEKAKIQETEKKMLVDFLFKNLEQYGDPKEDITKCIEYAMNNLPQQNTAGNILIAFKDESIVGAVILNATGMGGYIPENILVYIATDAAQRGQGIGKKLMAAAMETVQGDIALHVEPDNPAKKLYEKLGFTNKYLEMRLTK